MTITGTFRFNLSVFLLALLYLVLGPLTLELGTYPSVCINEIVFFMLPGLIYQRLKTKGTVLEMTGEKFELWPVILGTISLFPIVLLANGLFLTLISPYIELRNVSLEIIRKTNSLVLQMLVLALLPAVAEELFFRGLVQNYYIEKTGKSGIFISGFVFALFHFDIQNFVPPLLFGIFLGLLYYGSRRLSFVMLSHFLYNFVSLIFLRYYNEDLISKLVDHPWVQTLGSVETTLLLVLIFVGVIAAYLCFISLSRIFREHRVSKKLNYRRKSLLDFLPIVGIVALYLFYIRRF